MEFLTKISNLFGGAKSHDAGSLVYTPEYERFNLRRRKALILTDADLIRGYATHELVYACINKLADVMNDAEIIVEEVNAKGEWKPVPGHSLQNLFSRPNPYETGRDFRRLMIQSEQAVGLFYGELIRSRAGVIVEIHPLNPNRVTPKLDRDRSGIAYYEYNMADGRIHEILPENMLIRRRVDLTNRFYGLSPLSVALKSINSDLGLTDYIDAFFESDGTPSGILKVLSATLSDEKKASIQAQWQRKYSRGGSNQKGLAVLDQNAEYQKIGSNLDELASDALSGRFESRICSVFGVPPNLVGAYVGLLHVTANATAKADLRNFWDNKVSGELSTLREWMTWYLLPEFEEIERIKAGKVRVGFNIDHVAFLQEDVNEIHARSRENFKAGGITLNEFRMAVGLPPDKKGDYYLQPMSLAALSPENRSLEAFQKVPKDTGGNEPEQITDGDEPEKTEPKLLPSGTLEKKTIESDGLTLRREPSEIEQLISLKSIVSDFETEREKAVKVLTNFRNDLIDQAVEQIETLDADAIFTLTLVPTPKIAAQVGKILESTYRRGVNQINAEINAQASAKGITVPFSTKDEFDDEVEERLRKLISVTIAKIINEIQSRAVNIYVALSALLDFTLERLREDLDGESLKFIEQTAANIVNTAMQDGRRDEINDRIDADPDSYKSVLYSAILDSGTCGPCSDADGMEGETPDDVPSAPNPECEGGWNCRCMVILVTV